VTVVDLLPLVPALPLLGVVLLIVGGRWLSRRASGWLATAMVGLSFALSAVIGFAYLESAAPSHESEGRREAVVQVLWHWFAVGEDLVHVTIAAHDLPAMAPIPEGAVVSVPARMGEPQARDLFGPTMPDMWDPEAIVGLMPMMGPIAAGTPLTRFNVQPGPDGFAPAIPWSERRFEVDVALQLDGLSLLMMLVVSGVSFVIHLYSIGYMGRDPDARRFFVYLNLFAFSMLVLVMAANFLVMFVGWELVGLCSYLLIGFWYRDRGNADAGRKAFIVNRVGDFAFLLGLMLIWSVFGSLAYADVLPAAWRLPTNGTLAIAIATLLLVGATGKSAQIPLFVWLPDAMAGPTPVSALIHAATMVTAGVYMIVRVSPLFEQAPAVMALVALIGLATALLGGIIATVQVDIKRWLAYSTISQLGFMFLAVGAGAYVAGMLHLTAHAFFKALLFLGAGSIMHAMSGGFDRAGARPEAASDVPPDQDMRNMGGLLRRLRITGPAFLIGGLALAGLFPFVGFFSKDEILLETLARGGGGVNFWSALWAVAIVGALMTAFYTGRGLTLVLGGEARTGGSREAAESPPTMTVPLIMLAVLTVFGGILAIRVVGSAPAVEELLEPVVGHMEAASSPSALALAILATAVTLTGLGAAWLIYGRRVVDPGRIAAAARWAYRLAWRGFYVDEIYELLIVRPFRVVADFLWHVVDDQLVDGAVNGVGRATASVGQWSRRFQTGYVRTYVLSMLLGAVVIALYLILVAR
jgi:NADH-quinone oxidoreductase subunit L